MESVELLAKDCARSALVISGALLAASSVSDRGIADLFPNVINNKWEVLGGVLLFGLALYSR